MTDFTRARLVRTYRLYWDIDGRFGGVIVAPEGADKYHLRFKSPQEFMAVSNFLRSERPVYFDPKRKLMQTGPEPIGELED
ncbi:MAG: hypothetical protein AAFV29_26030 [Myxococcota bacterium]